MTWRCSGAGRLVLLAVTVAVTAHCKNQEDPPTNGSVQLFFQLDTAGLLEAGLEHLQAVELRTLKITAKLESTELSGHEYVLNAQPDGLFFPAETRFATGPLYEIAPGHVTQLRVYPSEIRLRFQDGTSAPVRLPSGEQTGWKIVVDAERYPEGYEVKSREITGIKLFLPLGALFHRTGNGWQARPTIESEEYNITESAGYDPDKIVVVFRPETSQQRIDQILREGGFLVDFAYPQAPPLLYKLDLPPNMGLREAHAYLRQFDDVLSAAPSARIRQRDLTPTEGTPAALRILSAEAGWEKVQNLIGSVGAPSVVVAQVAIEGVNIEHPDIWPNLWLNEAELLPICGTRSACDVDGDGLISLRDFNATNFPTNLRPPDVNNDSIITCLDLLATGSPYVNRVDDPPGNGFRDDICGWNFADNNRFPNGLSDHDTGVAGIMVGYGNGGGPGVGICWRCRLMPLTVALSPIYGPGSPRGATAEVIAAFSYARAQGAHIANFSAGMDLMPDNHPELCPLSSADIIDRKAYSTVVAEMNALVTAVLSDLSRPTTFFTLAGGECDAGTNDDSSEYYDWPGEAFASGSETRSIALTVAATANTDLGVGGLAPYSNHGTVFELAAPGAWNNMLDGQGGTGYMAEGTSFAAPAVAGLAGLIASSTPDAFRTPNAPLLKATLLERHSVVQPDLNSILGSKRITMENLP